MAHLEFIPEEFIALNQELTHHPALQELLTKHERNGSDEWELKLAEIGAYCSVGIDGTFTVKELCKIAAECTKRLRGMRDIVVNLQLGTVVTPDFKPDIADTPPSSDSTQ
jgi:hypothetical protein